MRSIRSGDSQSLSGAKEGIKVMAFFTHYWARDTFKDNHLSAGNAVGDELLHTAGNHFRSRGVIFGDTVYVISYHNGTLYVVARLAVESIVNQAKARAMLGYDLWQARDHVIAQKGSSSPTRFDRTIDRQAMRDIEFISSDGSVVQPAKNRHGAIDPQTFRGVREITPATAALFDTRLGWTRTGSTP